MYNKIYFMLLQQKVNVAHFGPIVIVLSITIKAKHFIERRVPTSWKLISESFEQINQIFFDQAEYNSSETFGHINFINSFLGQ